MFSVRSDLSAPFYDIRWYETFDYVILSSHVYGRYRRQPQKYTTQLTFYEDLEDQFTLRKIFDEHYGHGPIIKIYENQKDVGERGSSGGQTFHALIKKLRKSDVLPQKETAQFLSNIAASFMLAGDRERSLIALKMAREIDPLNEAVHYNLAIIYFEKGLLHDAKMECEKTLELNPHLSEIRFMLATLFEKMEQHEEVVQQYNTILEEDPTSIDAYLGLGAAYEKQGIRRGAKEAWKKVLTIDPSNKLATEKLQQYGE